MKLFSFNSLILLIFFFEFVKSNLLKNGDSHKYWNIIHSIYEYYHCHSITLLHTYSNEFRDVQMVTTIKNFMIFFTADSSIKTAVMDIKTERISAVNMFNINELIKPLFVIFEDDHNIVEPLIQFSAQLTDISQATWIIFSLNQTIIDDVAKNVHIPFNCKFLIGKIDTNENNNGIITEVYQVKRNSRLIEELFATWNSKTGILGPKLSFLIRRHNLNNHTLYATILKGPGVSIKRNKNSQIVEIGSYCGEIVKIFEKKMNFTLNYIEVNVIGSCSLSGTCTGGVDTMARRISDIFPFDLRISTARINIMDYTVPLYTTNQRLYIQKPKPKLVWNRYLKPFDVKVWDLIAWLFFIYSTIIIGIKVLHKNHLVQDNVFDYYYNTASDIFFSSFAAMCNKSIPEVTLTSLRVTQFTVYATVTVLYSAYSAILITSLAFQTFEPPFTTMEGLMEDGSYDLGILKDSADYDFFQNTSVEILTELFKKMMSYEASLPTSRTEGLKRICSNNKYAYLATDISTQYFPAKNCTLIPLNVISRKAPFSMALQRRSPFRDIFNYRINNLRESGILQKIFKDAEISDNEIENCWATVKLEDVFSLILFLLTCYAFSVIILIWELIQSRIEKQKKKAEIKTVIIMNSGYLPY